MGPRKERWGHAGNLLAGVKFLRALPRHLRRPLDLGQAESILRERQTSRQRVFLQTTNEAVFGNPTSPYLPLFRGAGCTFGDLEKSVNRDGLEKTLAVLFQNGVYLTIDEVKGRRRLERNGLSLDISPELLRNPLSACHVAASSGGSRSQGTAVLFDMEFIRGCAVNCMLNLHARGGLSWIKAIWEVPGGGSRFRLVKFAGFGAPPAAWFSQVAPDAPGLHPLYRWSTRAMRVGSLIAGVPLPGPRHAPLTNTQPIIRWMEQALRQGQTPHLFTFPSSAVALAQEAVASGISLPGAQATLGGEPITRARLASIRKAGIHAVPRYGSVECGPIGYGCLSPDQPDDIHLFSDLHCLIQADMAGNHGLPPGALLVTSLHPRSPFIFINASMGDQAVLESRRCGCPLESYGWSQHLHTIGSFEKLTGGGMTFHGTDVVRVLEEVLPERFGGAPGNYQLCEEESEDGKAVLRLLIDPKIAVANTDEVADAFLAALGENSPVNHLMETMWRESQLLKVEVRSPFATRSGKIMHFHVRRRPAS